MFRSSPSLLLILLIPSLGKGQTLEIPKDGPEVHTTSSGLSYSILDPGNGKAPPKPGDTVRYHVAGWLADGTQFLSTLAGPPRHRTLGVGMVPAWVEGMQLMSPGARMKLTASPGLAYGDTGRRGNPPKVPDVPPGATVVFELELIEAEKGIDLPVFQFPNTKKQKAASAGFRFEVLKATEGKKPEVGERFTLTYDLFNERGRLVATSRAAGQPPIVGRLTPDFAGPKFLPDAVRLMRLGERLRFDIPPQMCYGHDGLGFLIPPDSTTTWVLQLDRLDPPPAPRPLPPFARLNHLVAKHTASGLRYEVIEPGEGLHPLATDRVEFHYVGWVSGGRSFDDTLSEGVPIEVDLGKTSTQWELVKGLREGLLLMRPGAVYRFVLPPALAYGLEGREDLKIGPNRRLYYYVELEQVRSGQR